MNELLPLGMAGPEEVIFIFTIITEENVDNIQKLT